MEGISKVFSKNETKKTPTSDSYNIRNPSSKCQIFWITKLGIDAVTSLKLKNSFKCIHISDITTIKQYKL